MLMQLSVVVINMISHGVCEIKTNDIARHFRHSDIYVDVKFVCLMRRLDSNL